MNETSTGRVRILRIQRFNNMTLSQMILTLIWQVMLLTQAHCYPDDRMLCAWSVWCEILIVSAI